MAIEIATDASGFAWGAVVEGQQLHDRWPTSDSHPIHLKETDALIHTIQAFQNQFRDKRVDALVDNQALVLAWCKQSSKDIAFNSLLKQLFQLVSSLNCDLVLKYVPSAKNPADAPSRRISLQDARLSSKAWARLQALFGPHTFDLMAISANAMHDLSGVTLPFYSPCPLPLSAGVNVLCQSLTSQHNYYCFPPFCMVGPVVAFLLKECSNCIKVTLVVPKLNPMPYWWPLLLNRALSVVSLGQSDESDIIEAPSHKGYIPYKLRSELLAFRLQ